MSELITKYPYLEKLAQLLATNLPSCSLTTYIRDGVISSYKLTRHDTDDRKTTIELTKIRYKYQVVIKKEGQEEVLGRIDEGATQVEMSAYRIMEML